MSYYEGDELYYQQGPVAYADERHAPVPGWGMNELMAGPQRLAVGGVGFGATSVHEGHEEVVRFQEMLPKLMAEGKLSQGEADSFNDFATRWHAAIQREMDGTNVPSEGEWGLLMDELSYWETMFPAAQAAPAPQAPKPAQPLPQTPPVTQAPPPAKPPVTTQPAQPPPSSSTPPSSAATKIDQLVVPVGVAVFGAGLLYYLVTRRGSQPSSVRVQSGRRASGPYRANHPVDLAMPSTWSQKPDGSMRADVVAYSAPGGERLGKILVQIAANGELRVLAPTHLKHLEPLVAHELVKTQPLCRNIPKHRVRFAHDSSGDEWNGGR